MVFTSIFSATGLTRNYAKLLDRLGAGSTHVWAFSCLIVAGSFYYNSLRGTNKVRDALLVVSLKNTEGGSDSGRITSTETALI